MWSGDVMRYMNQKMNSQYVYMYCGVLLKKYSI